MTTLSSKNLTSLSSILKAAFAACVVGTCLVQTAYARDTESTGGKWIIGIKAAQVEVQGLDTDTIRLEEADAYGLVVGYEFNKNIGGSGGTSSFEVEYITTDDTGIEQLGTVFGEYDVDVINAFFTYRTPGRVFFKVKGGASYVDLSSNFFPAALGVPVEIEADDFSFGGGIGVGVRFGQRNSGGNDRGIGGQIELEYIENTGDAELNAISLNGLVTF